MSNEVWRDIYGYESLYQISDKGNVKSKARYIETRRGIGRAYLDKIMSPNKRRDGYRTIMLRKDGAVKSFRVHRLVAKHFLSDFSEDLEVNHKDMNRANNYVKNLEMLTHAENMAHAKLNRG